MEKETQIRPSLLSADFLNLSRDLDEIVGRGLRAVHYDVMDGVFVPQISFGEPILKAVLGRYGSLLDLDVHLMVIHPLEQVPRYLSLGVKAISFHAEAFPVKGLFELRKLKEQYPDVAFGLALNPDTPVESIKPYLSDFSYFLVMSVFPGKAGQSYIEGSEKKVEALDHYRKNLDLSYEIEVDGGLNDVTGPRVAKAGADALVMGSYYFKAKDRSEALRKVQAALR